MNLDQFIRDGARVIRKGAKIPWDDPDFSRRMLANHLSQDHDWASRREENIARQVAVITDQLEPGGRVLDLGCGPGLYTQRMAMAGFSCTGVDFSPASIEYARERAAQSGPDIEYVLGDVRGYQGDAGFDRICMTFGEFNVFTREDARSLLRACSAMLRGGGVFYLEAHTFDAVRAAGTAAPTWSRNTSGLFSEAPHLVLEESAWDARDACAFTTYSIIDAATATVRTFGSFMQAYTHEEYLSLLREAGFQTITVLGEEWPGGEDFRSTFQVYRCAKGTPS